MDDVHPFAKLLAEALFRRVSEQLFHGRIHVGGVTPLVDDLDRVTADLRDDAIALFALAQRLAVRIPGGLCDLLAQRLEFRDELRLALLGIVVQGGLTSGRPESPRPGAFQLYATHSYATDSSVH